MLVVLQLLGDVGRLWIQVVGQEVVEALLVALERTLVDAHVVDVGALVEHVLVEGVRALLLLLAHAVVVAGHAPTDPVVGAIAARRVQPLIAEQDARVARVGELGLFDQLEERRVRQRLDQLVLLAHRAVAVLVGPLVELIVEAAHHVGRHTEAGRDAERRRREVERIGRVVVDEYVEAALAGQLGHLVGHAGVELEDERVARAVDGGLLEVDLLAALVLARVELIAVQVLGMEQVGERAGIARYVLERAADEHLLQVAHLQALLEREVLACRPLVPLLQRQEGVVGRRRGVHARQVGLGQQLHVVLGVHWVHVAQRNSGEDGLELAEEAIVGGHLELKVLEKAVGEQVDAEAGREGQHDQPHDLEADELGAEDVGQAVDLDVAYAVLDVLAQAHVLLVLGERCRRLFDTIFHRSRSRSRHRRQPGR